MKIGEEGTSRKFINLYKLPRAAEVLEKHGYIQVLDTPRRKKGRYRYYQVLSELPRREEFIQLYYRHYTTTVKSLIQSAYGIVEDVRKELGEWEENLPEGIDGSSTAEVLAKTGEILQEVEEPDVPSSVEDIQIVFVPSTKLGSRNKRLAEALRMLEDVRNVVGDAGGADPSDELVDLMAELDEHLDSLENVECPGMFGG